MVQRKVLPNKLGIKAEHVKLENKHLANLKLSSSQNQDGKSRGTEMKKKMKKSKSIKLSHLESLQSSPSRRSMSQPGKPPPFHVPTASESPPQKNHPNYMKPTSSSHAKKELFPLIHRKTQLGSSDFKNLPRKFSNDVSKGTSSSVSSKNKATKALTRTSSMSLVRTLTKTTSFKSCRVFGPRKSTRATCSSTLKDSKFPSYLMLHPGGTESEGTSVMKVCPYNYCSLNGHRHSDLPPLKTFMSSRRRLLKTQKRAKVEALSPRRFMVPNETEKEDSVLEQSSPAFEQSSPVFDEIGIDFFIEIYANEKDYKQEEEGEMGKTDFVEEIEEKEDFESTIEDHGIIVDTPSPPKSVIDGEEDFEKQSSDDVGVEEDTKTKGFFLQEEQNEEDEDEENQASWSHEEMSMGSYLSDDSDSKSNDMDWEEDQFFGFNHEKNADSSVYSEEEYDSKVESSSESSHDVSVTWLDDILSNYYENFLVDEIVKEGAANSGESNNLEEQAHDISSILEGTNGSNESQETEYSTNEDNGGENLKQVDDEDCNMKALDEDKIDNNSQSEEMNESYKIDVNDEINSEENQINLFNEQEESITTIQDQEMLGEDQVKAKKFQKKRSIGNEEENTSNNWKIEIRRKSRVDEDDEEMRKFNPREPNFLPLVPEPEPEKVDLRHQMMDERKNAEEWMIDCALRQAVTKLAPARKKKVALLVEAFETVMPIPKFETHVSNNSSFSNSRRIQSCS